MKITYQSADYDPAAVRARYVRYASFAGVYFFCEVGEDRRFDIRQGLVDGTELPAAVRDVADRIHDQFFSYVDWPLDDAERIGQTGNR